jgi:hypothetical protein
VCYPCAAMQARCCHDPQNALVQEEGHPCAACQLLLMIHRMLGGRRVCYPCAAMQARCCDSQNALVQGRCAIPALHACCCHDPQNALVEEGVLSLRCHALAAVVIHRMLWWKKVCILRCQCKLLLL